jgi:hypothetical protein
MGSVDSIVQLVQALTAKASAAVRANVCSNCIVCLTPRTERHWRCLVFVEDAEDGMFVERVARDVRMRLGELVIDRYLCGHGCC